MFTNLELKYFKIAEEVSETSEFPRVKIGSIIVKKKEILSVGINQEKTHPMQMRYNKFNSYNVKNAFLHAEIDAIRKVSIDDLEGSSIYIYRKDLIGNIAMCRPCRACMRAIKDLGIKNIYYTTYDGFCMEVIYDKN